MAYCTGQALHKYPTNHNFIITTRHAIKLSKIVFNQWPATEYRQIRGRCLPVLISSACTISIISCRFKNHFPWSRCEHLEWLLPNEVRSSAIALIWRELLSLIKQRALIRTLKNLWPEQTLRWLSFNANNLLQQIIHLTHSINSWQRRRLYLLQNN